MKPCTVCGCRDQPRWYSARAWQQLSAQVLRARRGEHGNGCPGCQRDVHAASDLTVDHVVPLAEGGATPATARCCARRRAGY